MKYYKELLTIGIPAYNEEKYVAHTIESCINQAGTVIISDNASTDNTQKICEELAKKYPNLIYIRQAENIGGAANFNFVLNHAKTKYFMWNGGHDFLSADYSKHMLHMLENSDAVGCWPASRSIDEKGEEIGIYDFWYADRLVCDSAAKRVYSLISHLHDVSSLFGIHRSEIAKKYPLKTAIGNDHIFSCNMAKEGRIIFTPRSIYNWRQTKMNLKDSDNVKVWEKTIGGEKNKVEISRRIMKEEQLKILKDCGIRGCGFFGKIYLNYKAKKKLNKRFGN